MSFLRSLKPEAGMLQIFQAFPETARPLEYQWILVPLTTVMTASA
jgi:hypothetical protein